MGTPSNWLHIHMTCVHHSLKTSFLSSTRYSRYILNFSALSCHQPFLQEAGVPFQLKRWYLESRSRHEMCSLQLGYCCYCCSQVLTLSEDRAKKSMYVCVYINTHLCVHFTSILYLYLSILIKIHEFPIFLILICHHRIHSSFIPFNICNSLLQQ